MCALCETVDASLGNGASWSCKIKESATFRMQAKCFYACKVKTCTEEEKRNIFSEKTDCAAFLNTTSLKDDEKEGSVEKYFGK